MPEFGQEVDELLQDTPEDWNIWRQLTIAKDFFFSTLVGRQGSLSALGKPVPCRSATFGQCQHFVPFFCLISAASAPPWPPTRGS
eukprot:4492937-Pyramimonas_sp.AAC.1